MSMMRPCQQEAEIAQSGTFYLSASPVNSNGFSGDVGVIDWNDCADFVDSERSKVSVCRLSLEGAMRKIAFAMLSLTLTLLSPFAASAADTPRELGNAAIEKSHYVADVVDEQLDYIGDDQPPPWFYVQAEAMILRRETTNTNFPATSLGVAGPVIAQLQNLNFPYERGVKVTLGHRCNDCWSIEGVYFGQHEFFDQFIVADPAGRLFGVLNRFGTAQQPIFPSPPFPPRFGIGNATNTQSGDYRTRESNYELNAVRDLIDFPLGDAADASSLRVAGIAGLRYFRLREEFSLRTRGSNTAGLPPDPMARADYIVDTTDDAFGAQIGTRLSLKLWDRLTFSTEGKFAVLALGAEQTSIAAFAFFQPTFIPGVLFAGDRTLVTSYLGEITGSVAYQVTKYLTVRGGVDIFWLNNRALAPDQVDANATINNRITPMINTKGTTMFYGYTIGAEFTF
jgi:hypothetical protein